MQFFLHYVYESLFCSEPFDFWPCQHIRSICSSLQSAYNSFTRLYHYKSKPTMTSLRCICYSGIPWLVLKSNLSWLFLSQSTCAVYLKHSLADLFLFVLSCRLCALPSALLTVNFPSQNVTKGVCAALFFALFASLHPRHRHTKFISVVLSSPLWVKLKSFIRLQIFKSLFLGGLTVYDYCLLQNAYSFKNFYLFI